MSRNKIKTTDDLRMEYDLNDLEIRKVGQRRKQFDKSLIYLEADVANVFPNSESVNEALRFLIRVTKAHPSTTLDAG